MKTSTFRLLNILAINLLLLALYLNFIHEDNNTAPEVPVKTTTQQPASSRQEGESLTKTATSSTKQAQALN
ncbi:MAG TPA: hypothetical protein VGE66_14210 [Chitinophagaceae bacterium]